MMIEAIANPQVGRCEIIARNKHPLRSMAIWQYRLTLIPESVLLTKYEVLPLTIPMELPRSSAGGWIISLQLVSSERSVSSFPKQNLGQHI